MNVVDTNTVLLPNRSPLVTFRILFMTGSAYDPKGKEGLASLTAAMLAEGGSRTKPYTEITDAMYPMATSFHWQVDKEMSVFSGSTHVDNLDKYYSLIREMLLEPGFREDDFKRLKEDAINYLKTSLRGGNDEELGKEVLYTMIYPGTHAYGHQNMGAIGALEKLTLKDVRDFYQSNFTQANVVVGLAGGYPEKFPGQVQTDFAKLPKGSPNGMKLGNPEQAAGTKIQIVQRETRSTAVSLGFPINVTRPNKDWPALAVVASYFGWISNDTMADAKSPMANAFATNRRPRHTSSRSSVGTVGSPSIRTGCESSPGPASRARPTHTSGRGRGCASRAGRWRRSKASSCAARTSRGSSWCRSISCTAAWPWGSDATTSSAFTFSGCGTPISTWTVISSAVAPTSRANPRLL